MQVHTRPGQTDLQVDSCFQLASTVGPFFQFLREDFHYCGSDIRIIWTGLEMKFVSGGGMNQVHFQC